VSILTIILYIDYNFTEFFSLFFSFAFIFSIVFLGFCLYYHPFNSIYRYLQRLYHLLRCFEHILHDFCGRHYTINNRSLDRFLELAIVEDLLFTAKVIYLGTKIYIINIFEMLTNGN
jgi:hypothetical protein